MPYTFHITVVGEGDSPEEAWNDAKESAARKVADNAWELDTPPIVEPTKYVGEVTVVDPDTNMPVELEVRKLASGGMVGIDGSWLAADNDTYCPYSANVLLDVPTDEE